MLARTTAMPRFSCKQKSFSISTITKQKKKFSSSNLFRVTPFSSPPPPSSSRFSLISTRLNFPRIVSKNQKPKIVFNVEKKRFFSTSNTPSPSPLKEEPLKIPFLPVFAIGTIGGAFGSLVGLGGGIVVVPLLSMFTKMNQKQAIGTSLAGVLASGVTGTSTMFYYGSTAAVDFPSAIIIALSAALTARYGAKLSGGLSLNTVAMLLVALMLLAPVFVLGKPYVNEFVRQSREKKMLVNQAQLATQLASADSTSGPQQSSSDLSSSSTLFSIPSTSIDVKTHHFALVLIGMMAGFASGLLGIGGGMILTPLLAVAMSEMTQQKIIGTTLASLVLPSIIGFSTHYSLGNVVASTIAPSIVGMALGAYFGSRIVLQLDEQTLRYVFSFVMVSLAIRQLARRNSKK